MQVEEQFHWLRKCDVHQLSTQNLTDLHTFVLYEGGGVYITCNSPDKRLGFKNYCFNALLITP